MVSEQVCGDSNGVVLAIIPTAVRPSSREFRQGNAVRSMVPTTGV